jgi:iron complex outermembrane recepter protein
MTIKYRLLLTGLLVPAAFSASPAFAEDGDIISEVVVYGSRNNGHSHARTNIDPRHVALTKPDAAHLVTRVPGANVVNNGPVSGQVQYRGMFGARMKVQLDNMYFNSGGPNLMDPPLQYMPEPILDQLSVVRGIAPVSAGTSIGGIVKAKAKTSHFGSGDAFELQADVSASGRSVNDGFAAGGLVGGGTSKYRLHFLGSAEGGADTQFDGGEITPTGFRRNVFGVGGGFKSGVHEMGFNYRHHDTDHAGNPALPMDMEDTGTDIYNLEYDGVVQGVPVDAQIYYSQVDHTMDNYSQRPPPGNPMMNRFIAAASEELGFKIDGAWPLSSGELTVGADGHYSTNNMNVVNPSNAMFFVRNINDAEQDSTGAFIEWEGKAAGIKMLLGARYTHVETDADNVFVGPALPAAAGMLATRFNSADRTKSDDNVDIVGRFSYGVGNDVDLTLGLGRKTRSPMYIERYTWLPIEASSGLADGNNYVGNPDLDPEVSYEIEAGFDWDTGSAYFTPRAFYRSVDDFIQGMPIADAATVMVSTMNGDTSPLQFTNVDAELYGVDATWGYVLNPQWHFDGIVTYVRGKRRDTRDDLYRITPLRATASVSYMGESWSATVEGVGVAEQEKVSMTNGETRTGGHGLLNIHGEWQVNDNATIVAGVDNVFDNRYSDHLSGLNRASGSDVPIGSRLPGAGLNAFVRVGFVY